MVIREGRREDIPVLFRLIKELAHYEGLPEKVVADEALLEEQIYTEPVFAHFVIAELDNKPVGYAFYFYTFSTYLGKKCLYLEDLFILPEIRGKGFGYQLFKHIAQIAVHQDCGRMEWSVVNWNDTAKAFYSKLGAQPKTDHSGYSLERHALTGIMSNSDSNL